MKNPHAIRTLLGLTQQEAAILIRVSRSHWSMYESGKRDLPLHATQLLADMLVYVQSPEQTTKRTQAAAHTATEAHLERLLRENNYQQMRLKRQVAAAEKKQQTQMRLAQLTEFLKLRRTEFGKDATSGYDLILRKASRNGANQINEALLAYAIKTELLEMEEKILTSKLKALLKKEI